VADPLIFSLSLVAALSPAPPAALRPPGPLLPAQTSAFALPAAPSATPPAAPPPWRRLSVVTVGLLGLQIGTLSLMGYLPPDATGWGEGSFDQIIDNDLRGPKWDTDHWLWNYVAHPVAGSEYYLLARNREGTWWQSGLYALAMSTFWEYFTEAYYERPSRQDLLITPLAGTLLGELRWQGKKALRRGPPARWKTVLTVAIDPMDALLGGLLSRSGPRRAPHQPPQPGNWALLDTSPLSLRGMPLSSMTCPWVSVMRKV
jgi:hypothetical protein